MHGTAKLAGTDQRYFVHQQISKEKPVGTEYKQLPVELN